MRRRLRDRIKRSRKQQRYPRRKTHHHNLAKSRGGSWTKYNIFLLTEEHHRAYHKLFGNRTFAEAAEVLRRMEQLHRSSP